MPITAAEVTEKPSRTRAGLFTDEEAREADAILSDGKLAIHGTYETEGLARSAGYSLSRRIATLTGNAWRVTAWENEDKQHVGALEPKARIKRSRNVRSEDGQEPAQEPAQEPQEPAQEEAPKQSRRGRSK